MLWSTVDSTNRTLCLLTCILLHEICELFSVCASWALLKGISCRALLFRKNRQWEFKEETATMFSRLRWSKNSKQRQKACLMRKEEKIELYRSDKMKYQPYLFVRKQIFLQEVGQTLSLLSFWNSLIQLWIWSTIANGDASQKPKREWQTMYTLMRRLVMSSLIWIYPVCKRYFVGLQGWKGWNQIKAKLVQLPQKGIFNFK